MANLITIDQLLASVDLDFEPRYITKDKNGDVYIWANKPKLSEYGSDIWVCTGRHAEFETLKLAEFDGKDWTECIYELPRKTTGQIEKLPEFDRTEASIFHAERLYSVVNEIIDWINDNYKDSK